MIEPTQVEQVALHELQARLRQMGAAFVAEKSNAKRHVYWSRKNQFWILVTSGKGAAKLAYYPMTKCPCEDE
jgi:hypothetical protein